MNDKIQQLYNALEGDYNLGSIEDFTAYLQDESKRKMFYEQVISPRYNVESLQQFESVYELGVKKKDSTPSEERVDVTESVTEEVPVADTLSALQSPEQFQFSEQEEETPIPLRPEEEAPIQYDLKEFEETKDERDIFDPMGVDEKAAEPTQDLILSPEIPQEKLDAYDAKFNEKLEEIKQSAINDGIIEDLGTEEEVTELGDVVVQDKTLEQLYEKVPDVNEKVKDAIKLEQEVTSSEIEAVGTYDKLSDEIKERIEPAVRREDGKVVGLDYSLLSKDDIEFLIEESKKTVADMDKGYFSTSAVKDILDNYVAREKISYNKNAQKATNLATQIKETDEEINKLKANSKFAAALELESYYNEKVNEYNNIAEETIQQSILINAAEIAEENVSMNAFASGTFKAVESFLSLGAQALPSLAATGLNLASSQLPGNVRLSVPQEKRLMKWSMDTKRKIEKFIPTDFDDTKANFVGDVVGQIGFIVGSSALGGTPLAIAAGYTMSMGEMYEEAVANGLDHDDAMNLSMAYGAISAPFEVWATRAGIDALAGKTLRKKVINEVLEKGAKGFTKEFAEQTVKQSIKPIIKETSVEALEEGLQEGGQYMLSKGLAETYNIFKDKDKPEFEKTDLFTTKFLYELGQNILLGAAGGAIGGASLNILGGNVYVGNNYKGIEKMFLNPKQMSKVNDQLTAYRKSGKIKTDEDLQLAREQVGIIQSAAAEVDNATKATDINDIQKKKLFQLTAERLSLQREVEGVTVPSLVSDKKQRMADIDKNIEDVITGKKTIADIVAEEKAMTAKTEAEAIVDKDVELTEELKQEVKDIEAFFADSDKKISENLAVNKEEKVELSEAAKQTTDFAQKASSAISSILPNTKIVLHNTTKEYTPFKSAEGLSKGEYNPQTNTIHIDLSVANSKTVAHEVFHAVLLNKIKTEEQIQTATKGMYDSVKQSLASVPEISTRIENFSKMYGDNLQSEEALAELTGILASEYKQLNEPTKLRVKKWVNDIASFLGLDNVIKLTKDEEVIDLLNTLSAKVATGEQVTEKDIKAIKAEPTLVEDEFKKFVDTGEVSQETLNRLADIVQKGEEIKDKEDLAIYTAKVAEINKILSDRKAAEETKTTRAVRQEKISDEEIQAIEKVSELPTSIQKSLDFADKSAFNNKLEFKKSLQDRFNKDTYNKIKETYNVKDNKSNNDPGLKDYLIDAYLNETLTAIEAYPDALGWYDSRINGAMSFMEELHPELATDKNAESTFKIALAITSNGNKVYDNFVEANRQYEYFKENGKFDENYSIGDQKNGILSTLRFTNKALQSMSMSEFTNFLTSKYRAGDLKYIKDGKKTPLLPGFAVDEEVYGASIFGPKIGNGFFMNLYGEFNQLTMDRWFMRQYGRITGTLLDFDQAKVDKGDARLKKAIKGLGVKRSKILESIVPDFKNISNEELANKIQKASMDLKKRALFKSDIKLDEVRKAGNNLSKLYSAEVEAPKNSSQRKFINEVFSELQSKLKKDYGIDITIADLQAVNWYPEKALYQTFKADQNIKQGKVNTSDNEQPDYQSAAKKFIKTKGISENKIKENERRRSEQTKREDTDRKSIEQGARQFNKNNIKPSEIKRLKDKIISIKEEVTSNDLKEVATAPVTRQQKDEVVYHGSPTPIEGGVLKRGQSGAIFLTPNRKYAEQYSMDKVGEVTEIKISEQKKENLFDLRKPEHVEKLKEGYLKNNEELEIEYDTKEDALRDYDNAVRSMKEASKGREGINDWSSGSQFIEEMENAGFEGALFAERPAGIVDENIVISYALFDKQIPIEEISSENETTPVTRQQRISDEDIESVITEARNNNFTDEAIKYYLVNVKKQPATKVNELLEVNVNLLDRMPKSFGNIEGGAAKGVKLFEKVQKYHTKLNKNNNKRKPANRLNEQQIVDEVIKFLEKQPEYKKEGFPKKKEISTQQAAMLSDIQKSVRMRPTAEMAEKIREARMVLAQRKKGIADIKKVQSAVRNFMRKALPKKLYTKSETLKLINKINDATVKNIDSVIAKVEKFVIEQNIRDLNVKVSNLLDISRYTKTQAGKKVAKKIDSETLERVKYINKNILSNKATAEQIDEKNAELNREFNEISAKTDLTVADVQRMSDISIITGYNNSLQMDNQDATKVTQLDSVIAQLEGVIEYGSSQLAERIAEQKRETDRIFEVGYKAVTGTDIDLSAENANQVLEDKDFEFEYRKERKRLRSKLSNLLSKIGTSIKESMFGTAEALDGLMDKINILPAELFGGDLQEEFTNKIDEATRTFKERRMMAETTIKDKLVELYGKRWVNESRKNRDTINTGIYINEAAKKKDMPIMLSQNQMAYYYNQYKDPANRASFANTFGPEYERVMEEMTNKLDPKVKQLADWQVDEFYPSLYKYYNDAYKKIYNADMPWNQFYAGILYRKGETIEPLDLLADKTIYNTAVGANSTKSRVQNNNKIEGMDMVDVMATYINQMEYFAAYSQPIREMNTFFKNKYIRNAIETIHNKQTMKFIDAMIEKIANKGGKQEFGDEFVNALNSTFVTSRIGLSPVVMIKQLLSIPTYANDIGIINWTKYSAKNATQLAKTWKEVRDNSVYMQDRRNDSILRTIETYKDSDMVEFVPNPTKRWLVDFLMYTTKFGDRTAIMLGGMPNYLYYKDQELKKGKTEQQAIDIAIRKFERDTKRTQQSADLQDKDYFQTKGAITRALNMFLTTPKQYLRKEIQAVRNLGRMMSKSEKAAKGTFTQNFRTFVMYHAFLPVLFQYVALGLPGILREWRDDEDDKDLWRAAILGNLNALFLYGEIFAAAGDLLTGKPWAGEQTRTVGLIQSSMNVIKKLKKAMTIQDEDKKEKAQKDAILELVNMTGAPASTVDRMIQNYKEIGTDDDLGKDIMRVLNYSKYQIEGPKKKKQGFAGPSTTSMTDLKEYAPTLYDEIKALEKELKVDID